MTPKAEPHIPNLKRRIRLAFEHAYEHLEMMVFIHEDSIYALRAREFQAGLRLLDTLIVDDRFTSLGALNSICWDLAIYRNQLQLDKYDLKAWEIRDLIKEIDLVREKEF